MGNELSLIGALLVGLFGGVHCVGMCGGIVGALSLGLPSHVQGRVGHLLPYMLAYNLARILSYIAAGALVGGISWMAINLFAVYEVQMILRWVAGLLMVVIGLYLGGWWFGITYLERIGGLFWRHIEPFARRMLPVKTPVQAFALGWVWGWLPCGLVYSVLIWAATAGGALEGALIMAAFGVGTLPNLMAMGIVAGRLGHLMRQPWLKPLAGVTVIGFGIYTLVMALLGSSAGHHTHAMHM